MSFSLEYFTDCLISGLEFLPVTLGLGFIPLTLGTLAGTLVALARIFRIPVLAKFLEFAVPVLSAIPVMISLLILNLLYITLGNNTQLGTYLIAYLALFLKESASISESIRGAFLSIPRVQYEAAYASGLSTSQALRKIVIPQMVPVALPGITGNVVGGMKNTSIVLAVGITDVLNGATIPCAETYSYIEGYIAAAVIYWALNGIIQQVLVVIERRLRKGGLA